jgi:hypothetical protein
MNRFRGLVPPFVILSVAGAAVVLIRAAAWRSAKAEGAAWVLLLVGVAWLVSALVRVIKPLPIAVGVDVVIDVGGQPTPGTVMAMQGDECTVDTHQGSFLIDRYAIGTLMKVPRKRAAV